jgi:hypothetical protein
MGLLLPVRTRPPLDERGARTWPTTIIEHGTRAEDRRHHPKRVKSGFAARADIDRGGFTRFG